MALCGPKVRTLSAVTMTHPSLQPAGSAALALRSLRKATRYLMNGPGRPASGDRGYTSAVAHWWQIPGSSQPLTALKSESCFGSVSRFEGWTSPCTLQDSFASRITKCHL